MRQIGKHVINANEYEEVQGYAINQLLNSEKGQFKIPGMPAFQAHDILPGIRLVQKIINHLIHAYINAVPTNIMVSPLNSTVLLYANETQRIGHDYEHAVLNTARRFKIKPGQLTIY